MSFQNGEAVKPRGPRRSITATVLMSDEELNDLQTQLQEQPNTVENK